MHKRKINFLLLSFFSVLSCSPINGSDYNGGISSVESAAQKNKRLKLAQSRLASSRSRLLEDAASSLELANAKRSKGDRLGTIVGSPKKKGSQVLKSKAGENGIVKQYISQMTENNGRDLKEPLSRKATYLPMIEKVFDYYDLPKELANVPIIESKFDNTVVSEDGAVGIWQFMRPTAEELGLKCSHRKDERRDIFRSTHAAAKYLKELNDKFDDWLLSIAAYNAGPARVQQAIERANGEKDFFKLARMNLLPRETINHVSKFVAVTMITNNPEAYQVAKYDTSSENKNSTILGDIPLVD